MLKVNYFACYAFFYRSLCAIILRIKNLNMLIAKAQKLARQLPLVTLILMLYFGLGINFFLTSPAVLQTSFIDLPTANDYKFLPTVGTGGESGVELFDNFISRLVEIGKFVLEGVAIFFIIFYGIKLVASGGKDEEIEQAKTGFLDAALGFTILNVGDVIVAVFNPMEAGATLHDYTALDYLINYGIGLIKYLVGTISVAVIVIAGYTIVTSSDKQETVKKQSKNIVYALIGLVVVMLAQVVQYAIVGDRDLYGALQGNEDLVNRGMEIINSLTRLLLYIIVPVAILMLVIGTIYYVISGGEANRAGQGKRIYLGTIIALLIAFAAYILVAEILRFAL